MNHLTDDEIQSYFQGYQPEKHSLWQEHLSVCKECNQQLLIYRHLGNIISSALKEDTPLAFEETVMDKLVSIKRLKRKFDFAVAAIVSAGLVLVVLLFSLSSQLREALSEFLIDAQRYSIIFSRENTTSDDPVAILSYAVIIFVVFSLLDRLAIGKYNPISKRNHNIA